MVKIDIGGKERKFALNIATYRIAEKRHDVVIRAEDLTNPSLGIIASLLWIGLLADDPKLSEDKVLDWVAAMDDTAEVESVVMEALGLSDVAEGEASLA